MVVEEVQVGGAPAEHAEHWKAPEIVESALHGYHLQESVQQQQ